MTSLLRSFVSTEMHFISSPAFNLPACDVYPADGVRHGETFEDRHRVRYAISRIENDTCCSARRIPALPG